MARGRIILTRTSEDKEVNAIATAMSALFYTWTIAHLDREGRITGDPTILSGRVIPLWHIPPEQATLYIKEWAELGLVVWYEYRGSKYLEFKNFKRIQQMIDKNGQPTTYYAREPESHIPSPLLAECKQIASKLLVEEKRSKEKRSKENIIIENPSDGADLDSFTEQLTEAGVAPTLAAFPTLADLIAAVRDWCNLSHVVFTYPTKDGGQAWGIAKHLHKKVKVCQLDMALDYAHEHGAMLGNVLRFNPALEGSINEFIDKKLLEEEF
jgi:hypothetical protein